jgi:hypothetical protein
VRGGGAGHDAPGVRAPTVAHRGGGDGGGPTSCCSWLPVHIPRGRVAGGDGHRGHLLSCPT